MVAGGAAAGVFGSLLGLGGGILIVPLLTLGFGLPLRVAVGARSLAAGGVEWRLRRDGEPSIVPLAELAGRASALVSEWGLGAGR